MPEETRALLRGAGFAETEGGADILGNGLCKGRGVEAGR